MYLELYLVSNAIKLFEFSDDEDDDNDNRCASRFVDYCGGVQVFTLRLCY